MDRRFVLALLLTGVVVFLTPVLFPSARAPRTPAPIDSSAAGAAAPPTAPQTAVARQSEPSPAVSTIAPAGDTTQVSAADTAVVETPLGDVRFVSAGAALLDVSIANRRNLRDTGVVRLTYDAVPLLQYRLAGGADSMSLASVPFTLTREGTADGPVLVYTGVAGARRITVRYQIVPDSHIVRARVRVEGSSSPYLAIEMPGGLRSFEADTVEDARQLAYAFKPQREGARSVAFSKLEPGDRRVEPGPHTWVAAKSKYFIVGLLTAADGVPFTELQLAGSPRTSKNVTDARATVVTTLTSGEAAFDIYAGPQEWRRMLAVGRGFEDSNPYGGWFSGFVQPFATIVMRVLLWMQQTTKLSYGWVLVIFGVVVRLMMWPLQQKSMRSSIIMQRIQPDLQLVQQKHKNDPQRLQQEMMRVYKEHGMSPLSPLMGCLPMMLPMPILFALFFVFQNTIEFRGVPFLWLPDISIKDPYYIVPLLMGASMFLLSWIGMRGAPPNPQAKMMGYIFPPMMTLFFLNFASGLNLYYFVQNLAGLPQQWLLVRERAKAAPPAPPPPKKP